MKREVNTFKKSGKSTGGLASSANGLRESNKPRHYKDITHNYANFFGFFGRTSKDKHNIAEITNPITSGETNQPMDDFTKKSEIIAFTEPLVEEVSNHNEEMIENIGNSALELNHVESNIPRVLNKRLKEE